MSAVICAAGNTTGSEFAPKACPWAGMFPVFVAIVERLPFPVACAEAVAAPVGSGNDEAVIATVFWTLTPTLPEPSTAIPVALPDPFFPAMYVADDGTAEPVVPTEGLVAVIEPLIGNVAPEAGVTVACRFAGVDC